MSKIIYRFDYYARGAYRRKYVEVSPEETEQKTTRKAIKKSRLNNSIVDLCIVPHIGA